VLVPIKDFLITNLLVVMLFTLFDMLVCFKLFIRLTYIVSVYSRIKFVSDGGWHAIHTAWRYGHC